MEIIDLRPEKNPKVIKNKFFLRYLLFSLVLFIILVFSSTLFIKLYETKIMVATQAPKVLHHGPNSNIVLYQVPQNQDVVEVLGLERFPPPIGLIVSDVAIATQTPQNEQLLEITSLTEKISTEEAEYVEKEILEEEPEIEKIEDEETIEEKTEEEIITDDMLAKETSVEEIVDESLEEAPEEVITEGKEEEIFVPVQDSTSEYGISTGGMLAFYSQDKMEIYFEELVALGVTWIRWDFDWSVIQPDSSTVYDWSRIDYVISTAERYGIKTLGIITYAPLWARHEACKTEWDCAPASIEAFGLFTRAVVSRYSSFVSHWEIWNEPNLAHFGEFEQGLTMYSNILKEAYTEIKKIDSSAVVLSGGLAPSADEFEECMAPLTFLNALYSSNSNIYFDALAFHPYTYPALPSYVAPWNAWQQTLQIRQLMLDNGDENKIIWMTEFGSPTGGPGNSFASNQWDEFNYGFDHMTEEAQFQIVEDALNLYQQNKSWLGPFFYYSLQDNGETATTPENFFGLLRYDGTKKPAYFEFKEVIMGGL